MAADIHQQRRVVDDDALALIEAGALGEAQRDQTLAQDVLHRLPEPEIDAQRKRRHQLGQAYLRAVPRRFVGHRVLRPPAGYRHHDTHRAHKAPSPAANALPASTAMGTVRLTIFARMTRGPRGQRATVLA